MLITFLRRLSCALLITAPVLFAAEPVWIQWTPGTEPDLGHYLVCRSSESKPLPDLPGDLLATVETPFYLDTEAQPGSTYYYWVAAVDTVGNVSLFSGPLEVLVSSGGFSTVAPGDLQVFEVQHVDEDQDPEDPFVNRALDNDDRLDFSWTPPLSDILFYRIYLSVNGSDDSLKAVMQEPIYSLADAALETDYRLRVDAVDESYQVVARGYSQEIRRVADDQEMPQPNPPQAMNVE